ncbi:MAG TPA: F0F1 ATP synthase subunit B, partial [Burkholderiales bacterium]|nr:F0F1 ATP synthase subunit B [Burkholderiales bacterium]
MNINLTLIAQALAFALFIWFTVKFIWPPLMRAIEQRQKQIADGLAAGDQGRRDLEAAGRRAHEELEKARERVGEIIGSAEKRDAQMLEEAKAAARAEAERILAAA